MSAKFEDGKDEGALRTIGEVSKALGIKTHVLRYWEQQFSALRPLKRSGRRYYRTEDIALLETIDQLVNRDGYTLKGAQLALKDSGAAMATDASLNTAAEIAPGPAGSKSSTTMQAEDNAEIIAQIRSIRAQLAAALA